MISEHSPVCAVGRTFTKALAGANAPLPGSRSFTFANTAQPIVTGDPVFVSDASGVRNQYLGLCTSSGVLGIKTELSMKESVGSSGLLWKPTSSVTFLHAVEEEGLAALWRSGTTVTRTRGGEVFALRWGDGAEELDLRLRFPDGRDYGCWVSFLETERDGGRLSFSLAWWDPTVGRRRVAEVVCDAESLEGRTAADGFVESGVRLVVVRDDRYVEA